MMKDVGAKSWRQKRKEGAPGGEEHLLLGGETNDLEQEFCQ